MEIGFDILVCKVIAEEFFYLIVKTQYVVGKFLFLVSCIDVDDFSVEIRDFVGEKSYCGV